MTKTISLVNYKDLTSDGLVKKKLMKEGFSLHTVKNGQECSVNYSSELIDGRFVDNTKILKEPHVFILGKLNLIPGLEIGIRTMKMGETASFYISPQYSFLSQEKHKSNEALSSMKDEDFKLNLLPEHNKSKEDLDKMEVKDAKLYMPIVFEVELEKFDDPRPKKATLTPEERITQAVQLKYDGNELFKQKRFNEAIVRYKDGANYLIQLPNEYYNEKVKDLQNTFYLNISNSHIGLLQYNYALKNLNENIIFKKIPKVFYFKAICHMHLGEFDDALANLKQLDKLMPNDPTVKKAFDDYEKMKERTLNKQKENSKKGIFGNGGLYSEKEKKEAMSSILPVFDNKNKCFYLDFMINRNSALPYKIKCELFNHTKENIREVYDLICNAIKDGTLKKIEVDFDFTNEENKTIVLMANVPLSSNVIDRWNEINIYSPIESVLLILRKNSNNCSIELTTEALSASDKGVLQDYLVIGRCYYNNTIINKIKSTKAKGVLTVFEADYSLNL